ncbi:hypothetical protein LXA43DRAFT_1102118 [Ganoderma leucocontextum]|nr:hypothetical protein LXA43DRAFT_1102118 [Ganoderma leucocontextum]
MTGDSTGPSTFPLLIPELHHEDDNMLGDSQDLSDDGNYAEGTDFEDTEEFGYSTDAPTDYMSMANADTDYYSADADVSMDASGAHMGPSHTYYADQLFVSTEGEWDIEDDRSHVPTVEQPSTSQPWSNSGMVDISQDHADWSEAARQASDFDEDLKSGGLTKPEAVTSSKDRCNPSSTAPGSGSSGSDDADADAVEHQLLDLLPLRAAVAEEDTQATPIVSVYMCRALAQLYNIV